MRSYRPTYRAHPGQIEKAAALIQKARKPVIYAGGGVISSRCSAELKTLAEALSIPVTTTLMGLGAFPGTHPLWLGMLGMHGTYWANMAVAHCDVLIAIGARFDDRVTGKVERFAPEARIIHIDIDPTSIRKNVNVEVPIVGDCQDALTKLNQPGPEMARGRIGRNSGIPGWSRSGNGKKPIRWPTSRRGKKSSPSMWSRRSTR